MALSNHSLDMTQVATIAARDKISFLEIHFFPRDCLLSLAPLAARLRNRGLARVMGGSIEINLDTEAGAIIQKFVAGSARGPENFHETGNRGSVWGSGEASGAQGVTATPVSL